MLTANAVMRIGSAGGWKGACACVGASPTWATTATRNAMMTGFMTRTYLVLGSWSLVPGSWFLVPGSWFLVRGSWFLVPGSWFVVPGSWSELGPRTTLPDQGPRTKAQGPRTKDQKNYADSAAS